MALKLKKTALHHLKTQTIEKEHTILIVDDEESNLNSMKRALEKDYAILTSRNGQEALELIRNHENPGVIRIIISDQRMPHLTGVQLLSQTISLMPHTIRMILTGYTDIEAIIGSINEGHVYKFLRKPVEPHELQITIKRALETYQLDQKNIQLVEELRKSFELQQEKERTQLELQKETLRAQEEALEAQKEALKTQQEKEHLEILKKELEYKALKAQLNPHFLFNALNLIVSEIKSNPDKAVHLLYDLSDLLRGILKASSQKQIQLKEEISLITLYLKLQKHRFENLLDYQIQIPAECETLWVPSLITQPFVENAVVHGICQRKQPGCIRIEAHCAGTDLVLTISDNGTGFDVNSAKMGYGIAIIRETLQLLYKEAQQLKIESTPAQGTTITLQIPKSAPKNGG